MLLGERWQTPINKKRNGVKPMKITMFANMAEIREFCIKNNYAFYDVNLAQIYALYEIANWRRAKIAEHLGYAPSTVSTKRHYMWDFAELAEQIFINEVEVEETVVEEPVKEEKTEEPEVKQSKIGQRIGKIRKVLSRRQHLFKNPVEKKLSIVKALY